jgi:hypothetical protein
VVETMVVRISDLRVYTSGVFAMACEKIGGISAALEVGRIFWLLPRRRRGNL